MKVIIFSLLLSFSLPVMADYQEISDEAQTEVRTLADRIKAHLREAAKHSRKASDSKRKMESDPSQYDADTIRQEWDEAIAELRAGLFCNGCNKSRTQLRAEGTNFEDHVRSVGKGTSGAPQSAYDAADELYGRRWKNANELKNTYENSRMLRWTEVHNATFLKTKFHAKIQTGYDYQLKAYWPVRQNAINFILKNLTDLLIAQDRKVIETSKDQREYSDYVRNRYETTDKIDSAFAGLNNKRAETIRRAESKKSDSLSEINSIVILAATIGDEEVPTAAITTETFKYTLRKDVYLGMRASERLNFVISPEAFSIYRKTKTEGF